ncbi:MAG: hypothetical protein J6P50_05930, partial [Bacteroidales bacterium]|nr:hypothetical protein [Bacteroidales bacterium]
MNYIRHYNSPLGGITLASDGKALSGLWFDGQKYFGDGLDARQQEEKLPVFDETCRWLDIYFGGKVPDFIHRWRCVRHRSAKRYGRFCFPYPTAV